MNAHTSFPRSIRDVALDLINAAETLAEMRLDRTDGAWDWAREARSQAYFAKLERERAR